MKCPFCSHENTRVIDSRPAEDNNSIRRRRVCDECGKRFTTYEKVETIPLIIIKKDNNREAYDRSKIEAGVLRACHKRPVSAVQITNLVDDVETKIVEKIAPNQDDTPNNIQNNLKPATKDGIDWTVLKTGDNLALYLEIYDDGYSFWLEGGPELKTGYYLLINNETFVELKENKPTPQGFEKEVKATEVPLEAEDTFVIYNMGLVECFLEDSVCAFTDAEWRGLTVDDSTSWGIYDVNDPNFGLRNDIESLHKWFWYNCTQKCDMSSKVGNYATQFISWATCPEEINDLKPEQCFVNKIIASKSRFLLRCGTDTDGNMINIRFSVITDNGIIHHIDPVVSTPGEYTQLQDCWGKVQKNQWVYGTALEYDLSAYLNQEITILLETDQAAEGNPTIWLDAMALI